jgi:hypothetical protein
MVKSVEGQVTIRKGDLESLDRGVPVAEGDVIDSAVVACATWRRHPGGVRRRHHFQVAALFTDKNGERQVLLRLDQSRLRLVLGGQSGRLPGGPRQCHRPG